MKIDNDIPLEPRITRVQREIADKFIVMMKEDGVKWTKRWAQPNPCQNAITGHIYTGSNVLTTAIAMIENDWTDPRFLTIPQSRKIGAGNVIKGSKSTPIVHFQLVSDKNDETKKYPRARVWNAFNVCQFSSIDESLLVSITDEQPSIHTRNQNIDSFISNVGVKIAKSQSAFYNRATDYIGMPDPTAFLDTPDATASENYYSTLLHELIHYTGPSNRMDRGCFKEYSKSNAARAEEELIAEIGSVFLGSLFGLQYAPREDNVAYVQSWIKNLEDKPSTIFSASSEASSAIKWLQETPHKIIQAA